MAKTTFIVITNSSKYENQQLLLAFLLNCLPPVTAPCFRIMFKSGPGTISPSISQPRVKTAGTFYPGYSGKHQIIREAIYHSSPLSLGSSRARLFITTFYMVITDYVISYNNQESFKLTNALLNQVFC